MKTTAVYFSVQDKVDLKKHVKTTTAVYFSVQDKVNLKRHVKTTTAVYFSVQDKVNLKRHVKTTAVYFSVHSSEVCVAHRTKTPYYYYDSRPTLGGFRRPLCLLGVCGLVNYLHPLSDASPTLLFFGRGLSSPAKSTISQSFWATRSAKEVPAPPPVSLFSVGLRYSTAYLAF